jgi:thiol-disulfide isomerase/thioredoxin
MKKIILSVALFCNVLAVNAQLTSLTVGSVAPDFTGTDLHGNVHTKSMYAGKWLFVDLFADWCGPCQAVSPILNQFYKKYGCNAYNVALLAVEYDGTVAATEAFEAAYGGDANFPTPTISGLVNGGGAIHTNYPVGGFPTIILIGPDGLIKNIDIWPIGDVSVLETALTNAGGASQMIVHACGSANISENEVGELTVSPNPSSSNITLSFDNTSFEKLNIEIVNQLGQTVLTLNSNATTGSIDLDLSSLSNGIYTVKASNNSTLVYKGKVQIVK